MFFLFFPLPFSVNSVPSALASVKNKISLTMRTLPALPPSPPPQPQPPYFSYWDCGSPLPYWGAPSCPPQLLLPAQSAQCLCLAFGSCGRGRVEG